MKKIWYIQIKGEQEGPYSLDQLKMDARITPDTLVWRQGFKVWMPARDVPELKDLFKDEKEGHKLKDKKAAAILPQEEIALDWRGGPIDPNFLYLLLMILLLILSYLIYVLST